MRGNYISFKGTILTVAGGMHQFTMNILSVVPPVGKGRSVQRAEGGGRGGVSNSLLFRSHRCISG